ncbi:MAG: TRAP transporter small permease [Planctomycetota bacterium]
MLVTILIISTTLQVLTRFVIRRPLIWTEEVSRFSFVWMVFLGASLGVYYREHFMLEFILERLTTRWRARINLILHVAVSSMAVLLTVVGYEYAIKGLTEVSPATRMQMFWIYLAIPVSGVLMLTYLVEQAPGVIKPLIAPGKEKQ